MYTIAPIENTKDPIEKTKAVIGQKLSSGPSGSTVGSTATTANAATINVKTKNIKEMAA